jgi:hypothetical protein
MERIVARVVGFIILILIFGIEFQEISQVIYFPILIVLILIAVYSTWRSYHYYQRNILEVSSHATWVVKLLLPISFIIVGFIVESQLHNLNESTDLKWLLGLILFLTVIGIIILAKYVLIKYASLIVQDEFLVFDFLFFSQKIHKSEIQKLEWSIHGWLIQYYDQDGKVRSVLVIGSWFDEFQRKFFGKSTYLDQLRTELLK